MAETSPQQATGLEKLVLGAIMSRSGSREELMEEVRLTPEMFYNTAHQTIFRAILDNNPYDLWTITQYLIDKGKLEEIGGAAPLAELVKYGSTNGEAVHHAKVIIDKFIKRQTWEILQKSTERCQSADDINDIIDDIKTKLTDLVPVYVDDDSFEVDLAVEPAASPAILYIKEGNKLIPLLTLKNISLIIGKARGRKSFLTVLLTASYLGYKNDLIEADPDRKGMVMVFDTEQSPYDLHVMMKRICRLIGISNPKDKLRAFGLKTMTPQEKIDFIDRKIKNTPDLVMVIIDGTRDLVFDINSPEEATKTSVRLMKWVAEYDIHIINVLHQNKGDMNARGHLGTELVNKSERVLSVNKEEDTAISTVEDEFPRGMEIKPFSFSLNDDLLPVLCNTPEKEPDRKRIPTPNQLSDEQHCMVLDKVYKNITEQLPTHNELTELIIEGFDFSFGESNSKKYIRYYLTKGWITKQRDKHKMIYKYERATF